MELRPGYKQTEVGIIPEEWEAMPLGNAAEVIMGQSPAGSSYNIDGVGVALINGPTEFTERHPIKIQWTSEPTKLCKSGDILLCVRGSSTGRFNVSDGEYCIGRGVAAIRARPGADPPFITFQVHAAVKHILALTTGSTFPNIDGKSIRTIQVPLPPLPEQRAIAAALGNVESLLDALTQLIAKKRDLKQAAMQQLLTGQTRLQGCSGKWELKRLGEVTDVDPENLGSDTRPDYVFNYISLEDVDSGRLRSHSERVFRTAPSRARRKLRKGDILVSTVRPSLKSHLLFDAEEQNWVCSTGFAVVRCREPVTHPGYVFAHMFGDRVSRQIDTLLTGSNYPAINGGDVRALEIPFPEYDEQAAIAAVLSDMDAELAALEHRLAKTRALKQGMMQELLTGRTRLV